MSSEHDGLKAQYVKAKARLNTAEEDVRRVSRSRLAELMRLPERQRFEHLEDLALTPGDRSSLLTSVAAKLAAPRSPVFSFMRIVKSRFGRLVHHLPALVIAIVMAAPLGGWIAMAWLNAGEPYVVEYPITLDWRYPSGQVRRAAIAPGNRLVLVRDRGTGAYFRFWIAGQGYATAVVNYIERPQ